MNSSFIASTSLDCPVYPVKYLYSNELVIEYMRGIFECDMLETDYLFNRVQ
jgi:hypothetical protein